MKKLRCDSCGGELKVEDNNEYAFCSYCKTRYKLNEDKTVTIKMDEDLKEIYVDNYKNVKRMQKPIIIITIIMFVFIFGFGGYSAIKHNSSSDKRSFNFTFEHAKGTQYYSDVETTLDKVSTNNQTNKRKITVVYNNKEYVDSNDIIDLKHTLNNDSSQAYFKKYEVKLEYDKKGYINKIIIEDIK